MKKNLLLFIFSISIVTCNAQITFQKTFDHLQNVDRGNSLQITFDGGYIIAGQSDPAGGTEKNLYLIKTDSLGDTTWTKTYVVSESLVANSIAQTSDSGFIITGSYGVYGSQVDDVYLAKTNSLGDTMWTRTFGGSVNDIGNSVIQTLDGGYMVLGATYSFGAGSSDIYAIKTDAGGDTLWTRTYGGFGMDWGSAIQQTIDSCYIICGTSSSFSIGQNIYLLKIAGTGDTIWTKSYGTSYSDGGFYIQQTSDNGFILAGYTGAMGAGNFDIYLVKTDEHGDTLWTKAYGGPDIDQPVFIEQTNDGGFVVTGETQSFGAGGFDVYLIKTDFTGGVEWSKTFGGPVTEYGTCVKQTSDSGFILTGVFYGGAPTIYEAYLIKTDPSGNSGCFENNVATISTTPVTTVAIPGSTISSGTNVKHTNLLRIERGSTVTTLCSSVGVQSPTHLNHFEVFPNPASREVFITSTQLSIDAIDIYTVLGEKVIGVKKQFIAGKMEVKMNISSLIPGIYFVRIQNENETAVGKLIVE